MSAPRSGRSTLEALHRSLVWAQVVVVIGAVLGCTAVLLIDPHGIVAENVYGTSALLPLGLGALLAALSVIRRGRTRDLMILSMVLTAGGGIVLIMVMWHYSLTGDRPSRGLSKLAMAAFIAGVALAHSGAMFGLVQARTMLLRFSRVLVVVMVWLFAALIIAALLMEEMGIANSMGAVFFLLMVGALLGLGSILGTIIVPVAALSQANRRVESDHALDARLNLTLACPKCGERQTLQSGFNRCAKCRASMFIELEEPRCECGYLLFRLVGNACPECGRSIRAAGTGQAGASIAEGQAIPQLPQP